MDFKHIVTRIVGEPGLHARFLNSLSMMENTGSRKISAGEDAENVSLMVLKHAAEEARHAYYLKKQIAKIGAGLCPDYKPENLLAARESRTYLNYLDVAVCRLLKREAGMEGAALKFGAYLLVTYAIEVRADALYPVYQDALTAAGSKVNVKSIIAEEETHLAEMLAQMKAFFGDEWESWGNKVCQIEDNLFAIWSQGLAKVVEAAEVLA